MICNILKQWFYCPTGHSPLGNSAIPHQWGIPHRLRTTGLECVPVSLYGQASSMFMHEYLCHPSVMRLMHFFRSKNFPFSSSDVKQVCSQCRICAEIKPKFQRLETGVLIKAMQPWERNRNDFKGPVKSSRNPFLLVVVDESSRFPFVFPCHDVSAKTVINCLSQLFFYMWITWFCA